MSITNTTERESQPQGRFDVKTLGKYATRTFVAVTLATGINAGYKIHQYAEDHPSEYPHGVDDRRHEVDQEQKQQAEIGSAPQLAPVAPTADQAPSLALNGLPEDAVTVVLPVDKA